MADQPTKAELQRLADRMGRDRRAKHLGMKEWELRKLERRLGVKPERFKGSRWTEQRPDLAPLEEGADGTKRPRSPYTADDYLLDNVGERSRTRMAREIGCSEDGVRCRLSHLERRPKEHVTDFSVEMAADHIGRSIPTVMALIRRKELEARQVSGVWRIHASKLRDWICAHPREVEWGSIGKVAINREVPDDERATVLQTVMIMLDEGSDDHKKDKRKQERARRLAAIMSVLEARGMGSQHDLGRELADATRKADTERAGEDEAA